MLKINVSTLYFPNQQVKKKQHTHHLDWIVFSLPACWLIPADLYKCVYVCMGLSDNSETCIFVCDRARSLWHRNINPQVKVAKFFFVIYFSSQANEIESKCCSLAVLKRSLREATENECQHCIDNRKETGTTNENIDILIKHNSILFYKVWC